MLIGSIPEMVAPEKIVHRLFGGSRHHGEWFQMSDPLAAWLLTWPLRLPVRAQLRRAITRRIPAGEKKVRAK